MSGVTSLVTMVIGIHLCEMVSDVMCYHGYRDSSR
jgi:hypothetical protein